MKEKREKKDAVQTDRPSAFAGIEAEIAFYTEQTKLQLQAIQTQEGVLQKAADLMTAMKQSFTKLQAKLQLLVDIQNDNLAHKTAPVPAAGPQKKVQSLKEALSSSSKTDSAAAPSAAPNESSVPDNSPPPATRRRKTSTESSPN